VGRTTVRLLFVCTGNICRSPVAERLTRAALGPAGPLDVVSAGLAATPGRSMDPSSAAALEELGGDPADFQATRLDATLLDSAALVVTMTHAQRDQLLARFPRHLRRTFVLSEAATLAELVDRHALPTEPGPRLEALAAALAAARAQRASGPTGDPDVPDPIGRPPEEHRAAAGLIDDRLRGLLELLADPLTG
jgi:protein-tyrosine phosphatase